MCFGVTYTATVPSLEMLTPCFPLKSSKKLWGASGVTVTAEITSANVIGGTLFLWWAIGCSIVVVDGNIVQINAVWKCFV